MTDERNKIERELEGLIRELPPEPAVSPDFAADLRASFASGAIEPGSYTSESDIADSAQGADPLDLESLTDLTGVWSEEVGTDIADATGAAEATEATEAIRGPREVPSAASDRSPSGSGRVLPFPVWAQALVLAAAVALIFFARDANRGAGPEQIQAQGNGTISIDGESFALSELERFRSRLEPGVSIQLEGDMSALLDLVYPGFMAVQVTPGVEMTIPEPAGRWFGRTASFEVEHGEVRVVTGPDFAGADLSILAPGTEIEITGTTFAVICSPCSTCVCVLEGTAKMKDTKGHDLEVRPGRRQTFFNDKDDPPLEEPIRGDERMKLEMLRDSAKARLAAGRDR